MDQQILIGNKTKHIELSLTVHSFRFSTQNKGRNRGSDKKIKLIQYVEYSQLSKYTLLTNDKIAFHCDHNVLIHCFGLLHARRINITILLFRLEC